MGLSWIRHVQFLVQVTDVVGWCRTYHASLHPAGIVSCTSLSFLLRGFRRKVDESILMEGSSWVHLEAFLNLRPNVVAKEQDSDDEQID